MADNYFDSSGSLDEPILTDTEIGKYKKYFSDYGEEILFSQGTVIVG